MTIRVRIKHKQDIVDECDGMGCLSDSFSFGMGPTVPGGPDRFDNYVFKPRKKNKRKTK